MRKLLVTLLAMLSFGVAYSQTTIPEPTRFDIMQGPGMVNGYTSIGLVEWKNVVGEFAFSVQRLTETDSIHAQTWELEVTKKTPAVTSGLYDYTLSVKGFLTHAPTSRVEYTQEVPAAFSGMYLAIPKYGAKQPNGGESPFLQDSLFAIYINPDTLPAFHNVGDKIIIKFDRFLPLKVDRLTSAIVTIDYAHFEKHDGASYHISADSSLAGANDTLSVSIITPDTDKRLHLIWEAIVSAKCWFFVKSAPTLSVVADTLVIYNDDFNSSNASVAYVFKAPRTADTGTLIHTQLIGSTNKAGSSTSRLGEVILKEGTTYVIGVHSTAAADASINLHWYEHTNRD